MNKPKKIDEDKVRERTLGKDGNNLNGEQLDGTRKVVWDKLQVILTKFEERPIEQFKKKFRVRCITGKTKDAICS